MARRGNMDASHEAFWPSYVPVKERRRKSALAMEKLRKKGYPVSPVTIEGRAIATTFWGKAWCDNLESYRDYENRIERGRTYVRNGSVIDLQIGPCVVMATVSGSRLYKVKISIDELPRRQWASICRDCVGGIASLVELLQGRIATGLMERICRGGKGLFPMPAEIHFSCSCPDQASMCKHTAAVLYGVGARLDAQPELLFRLRAVDENDLVAQIDSSALLARATPLSGKMLETDDLSALFGLDLVNGESPGTTRSNAAAAVPGTPATMGGRRKQTARTSEPEQIRKVVEIEKSKRPSKTAMAAPNGKPARVRATVAFGKRQKGGAPAA